MKQIQLFHDFVKFPHRIQKASHAVRTLRSMDIAHNFDSNDSLWFFLFVLICAALLLFHLLGKLCPGVTVLTASLRPSRKSPFPLQAMRRRIHLQVKYSATSAIVNIFMLLQGQCHCILLLAWMSCLRNT